MSISCFFSTSLKSKVASPSYLARSSVCVSYTGSFFFPRFPVPDFWGSPTRAPTRAPFFPVIFSVFFLWNPKLGIPGFLSSFPTLSLAQRQPPRSPTLLHRLLLRGEPSHTVLAFLPSHPPIDFYTSMKPPRWVRTASSSLLPCHRSVTPPQEKESSSHIRPSSPDFPILLSFLFLSTVPIPPLLFG